MKTIKNTSNFFELSVTGTVTESLLGTVNESVTKCDILVLAMTPFFYYIVKDKANCTCMLTIKNNYKTMLKKYIHICDNSYVVLQRTHQESSLIPCCQCHT